MKYALIGCGRIAPHHISAARKNGLEIVAVCDIDKEKMQAFAKKQELDCELYTDYKQMLEKECPTLVAIATDSGCHAEIAKATIKMGINVIIEKPISLSLADAREIIELSKQYSVKVCACHQNRFNAAIQKAQKALSEGRFGKLSHGAITVRWSRGKAYYDQADWRGTWQGDGGTLMNQCIHGFDLLRWFFGDEIEEVYGSISRNFHPYNEAEDLGMALIKFKNGATATAEGTVNIYDSSLDTETLCIYGDKGAAEIGGTAANKITVWSFADGEHSEEDKLSEEVKNVYGNGHDSIYADVIDAIENDRAPYVDAEAGYRALELILAIYKSQKEGVSVKLPLDDFSTTDMLGYFE